MPMKDAAEEIVMLMGVELDPRCSFYSGYKVDYPTSDPNSDEPVDNNYTLRDILRFIANAHIGNWTMTDAGKLLLLPLNKLPPETHYLVTRTGRAITLGGKRILV